MRVIVGALAALLALACVTSHPAASGPSAADVDEATAGPAKGVDKTAADEQLRDKADLLPSQVHAMNLDAWSAAAVMSPAINIGNTLENTTTWETGWGNPPITREFVQALADLGFKTIRLPVAWDTYAQNEVITTDKMARVTEVVDSILEAGMFAVVNIHWDGGWIDSSNKEKFAATHATFSKDAQRKFVSYWRQIATHFESRGEKLLFEGLNEETNFSGEGSNERAYATLTRVNQLFVDTVRSTGGNNEKRLLVITGYHTDIEKTCSDLYQLPKDTVPHRLFLSVHYYTPWNFCGLEADADWGKVMNTWGTAEDIAKLHGLFDKMAEYSKRHDIPVFLGEYNATEKREAASRERWLKAVTEASLARNMVPVLWDTGGEVSRKPPHKPSPVLEAVLRDEKISAHLSK